MAKQQRIDPRTVERRRAQAKSKSKSGHPGRSGRPVPPPKPATLGTWIAGARPFTLPLAVPPVALGAAAASTLDQPWSSHWARMLLCLGIALALQIGANYANDYSDGVRGTDRDRVGPQRLVASGRAKPRTVLTVAIVFFGIAAVLGLLLMWRTGLWWFLLLGVVCLAAAWFYTGGRRPYGYAPLGELAVLLFFGVVPAVGTAIAVHGSFEIDGFVLLLALLGGVAAGFFAAAVLMSNNLRDRERDATHGKRTLSVLIGSLASRILFAVFLAIPFGLLAFFTVFFPNAAYSFFALLAAIPAALIVITARTPRELVTALQLTVLTAFAYGLGVAAAIAL